jgi:hypothetical protein
MRGIGGSCPQGVVISRGKRNGARIRFRKSPKDEVGMHPKGITDSQIQLISGHESKKSLEIYQHLSLQSVDKAYQEAVQNAGI